MKHTIEKIPLNSISYDDFIKNYYTPERPVVLTGVKVTKNTDLTPNKIKQYFYNENNREAGWFDAELPKEDNEIIKIPEIVRMLLSRDDISTRKRPMRAFMQPQGHKTLLHYDGNSLNGLNLQVKGEKEWTIISPNTAISFMPFNFVAAVSKDFVPDGDNYDFYTFKTLPGEMLFVPRYWLHEVSCKAEVNINLNWVFTPNSPSFSTKLSQREGELLKLRQLIPIIRRLTVNGEELYGGAGKSLEQKYINSVRASAAITRFFKEIAAILPFLKHIKDIKQQAEKFSHNNFNISP